MHRSGLAALALALGLSGAAPTPAIEASVRDGCQQMIRLLTKGLQDLTISSCERSDHAQVSLALRLDVPAVRVVETEAVLIETYDMKPLKFVCCGYQSKPITVHVPDDHPLTEGTPREAYRDISLSFSVPGFAEESGDLTIQPLGRRGGVITLELVDY